MQRYVDYESLGKFSYDDEDYEVLTDIIGTTTLHYIGKGIKPIQPIGCISFAGLFENRNDLEILDLTGWDISDVKNFYSMFYQCNNLKEIIGIDNWDMSKVKRKYRVLLFAECPSLEKYPDWYTYKLYDTKRHSATLVEDDIRFESIQSKKKFESLLIDMEFNAQISKGNFYNRDYKESLCVGIRKNKAYVYDMKKSTICNIEADETNLHWNHLHLNHHIFEDNIKVLSFTSYQSRIEFEKYLLKITAANPHHRVVGVRNGKCHCSSNVPDYVYKYIISYDSSIEELLNDFY